MTYDIITTESVTRRYRAWVDEQTVADLNKHLRNIKEDAPVLDLKMVLAALTDRNLPILDTKISGWYSLRDWIIEEVRDEAFNDDCDDLDSEIEYSEAEWDLTHDEQELVEDLKPLGWEDEANESDNG